MGADVMIFDTDTAHRVPSRSNNGNPKPIVCRFVKHLAKKKECHESLQRCMLSNMYLSSVLSKDKPIYIMSNFNIDLLKPESCDYSHNFLLSLQSYSIFPVLDRPTGVYDNSAILIDNILVNRFECKL